MKHPKTSPRGSAAARVVGASLHIDLEAEVYNDNLPWGQKGTLCLDRITSALAIPFEFHPSRGAF